MPVKKRKRRTANVGSVPKTKKFNGKQYKHSVCGTKTEMKKRAAAHRSKGKGKAARVVKTGSNKYCLYKRG